MELVPIPAVLSAPYAGVQLSEEAARAPGRGLQSAGRSLMEVGDQVQELGQRMQHAKDNVDLLKAKLAIDEVTAEEEQWRAVNPDEDLWEPRALESVTKVDKKIAELKLSKSAKDRLLPTLMEFRQKHPTTVKYAAMQKRIESLRQTGVEFSRIEAGKGNLDKADTVIDQLVTDGVMKKADAWIEKQSNGRIASVSNATQQIRVNPFAAMRFLTEKDEKGEYVNYSNLSTADRTTLEHSAHNAIATMREETAQSLGKQIYEAQQNNDPAKLQGMDTRIDMMVKDGALLASQAATLNRALVGKYTYGEQAVDAKRLWSEIDQLKAGDPSTKIKATDIRAATAAMDPVIRAPLLTALEAVESSTTSKQSTTFANQHIDRLFNAGVFGVTLKENGEPAYGDQFVAASEEVFRLKTALQKFIAENPDGDQIEFLNKQVRQRTTAAGGTGVLNSLTARKKR